jgi:hypothetical protein
LGGIGGGEGWGEDEEEGEEEKGHGAERTWGAGGMFWVGVRILREGNHEFHEGHEWDVVVGTVRGNGGGEVGGECRGWGRGFWRGHRRDGMAAEERKWVGEGRRGRLFFGDSRPLRK